jgi:cysteine-rich repeat protein
MNVDASLQGDAGGLDGASADAAANDSGIIVPLDGAAGDGGGDGGTSTDGGTDAAATDAFVAPDTGSDAGPRCGDGMRSATEQCDDGNLLNLDGCDASCRYEAIVRLTSLAISGGFAPASCTPTTNALGTQVIASSTALNQFNALIAPEITNGTLNLLVQAFGLADLTGTNDPAMSMGLVVAQPDPAAGTWPSAGNPIDWQFIVDHATVGPMGLPSATFPGSIAAHALTAGPTTISFPIRLSADTLDLQMTSAHVFASIDTSPPPNHPAPPPASLDPALVMFQSLTASGSGQGLCGNITVQSLAQTPVPQALTTGTTACAPCNGSHTYTYCGAGMPVGPGCNSLLDVFVGGCGAVPLGSTCFVQVIAATQPDVAGGASVRPLMLGANNKVATDLTGDTDAYSSFFTFTANRAHASGESCAVTGDCQAGQTCTSMVCR